MATPSQPVLFTRCVGFGDDDAILQSFQEDGVVVVSDVLGPRELDAAIEELWTSPRLLARDPAVRQDDPSTWSKEHWPQADGGRNFLTSCDSLQDRTTWELIQHPNIAHVLKLLYGGPVVHCGSGRWGVMRPTLDHPEWRTDENWLHWDQNPWREPGFTRVQAFVCLTAQTSSSGGLLCVPGFHKRWQDWGLSHPEGTVVAGNGRVMTQAQGSGDPFQVPDDDGMHNEVVRVLAPAGALVLWDARLPHQNYPNSGTDFRIVHYLSYMPPEDEEAQNARRIMPKKALVCQVLGNDGFFPSGLSDVGREVTCVPAEIDGEAIDDNLREAILLAHAGGEDEMEGRLDESCRKLARAERLFGSEVTEWMEAVFGDA